MFKKLLLVSVIFACAQVLFSQAQFSPATKRFLFELKQSKPAKRNDNIIPNVQLINEYALYYKNQSYYIGALLLVESSKFNSNELGAKGITNFNQKGNIFSIRLPVQFLESLAQINGVLLVDIGDPLFPDLENAIKTTKVDSVHRGLGALPRAYTGKGVVVAVIDWGFDYTHPMFYDSTLSRYRVVRAWDQNKLSGPPPNGFDFGTAYETQTDLLAAQQDTLYVFGPGSHGTHVAGIAAGGGAGVNLIGMAPESDLILISLRRDAPSLIDAYHYIEQYSRKVNKPFVVNMSFGNHLGPHDGTTLENIGIDAFAGKGKILVGSAGNNGDANFHIQQAFKSNTDTLRTVVNFTTLPDYFGQTLSMWGSKNSSFSVRFSLLNNQRRSFLNSSWFSTLKDTVFNQIIGNSNGDSIEMRFTITNSFVTNQKPNIRVDVRKKGNLKLLLEAVSNTNCDLHVWNNVRLFNRYTNWGVPFTADFVNTKSGNTAYGVGEPAGVGKNVLTVASYRSEVFLPNGLTFYGQISSFSSHGPTVDERRKPDIAGPGQLVISSVNSFDPNPGTIAETTQFNGKNYQFVAFSGTSMSGPAVAGIVALMLEMNPNLNHTQIKEIIQNTARLDKHTGQIADTGSLIWGRGKINAYSAMLEVKDKHIDLNARNVFPNPSAQYVSFSTNEATELVVVNASGKQVISNQYSQIPAMQTLNLKALPDGIYFFKFITKSGVSVVKWVKSSSF